MMTRTVVQRIAFVVALLACVVSAVALSGGAGAPSGSRVPPVPQPDGSVVVVQAPRPAASVALGSPDADAPAPASYAPASTRPVRLQIAAIGVDTGLEPLGTTADGTLAAPSEWQRAGWYADGVHPGDVGPAVIAGHVDSTAGPAVFFRLGQLRARDRVIVTRADGDRLVFAVDDVRRYAKSAFPTAAVYGPTSLPLLRLVTCTGDFDERARSYLDNLVVTSHLVGS